MENVYLVTCTCGRKGYVTESYLLDSENQSCGCADHNPGANFENEICSDCGGLKVGMIH